jgi:hypothetical protein
VTLALLAASAGASASLTGCSPAGAPEARRKIREIHAREVQAMVRDDLTKHRRGIVGVAERIAPILSGNAPTEEARERALRAKLKAIRIMPRGVSELVASPATFVAGLRPDGIVIARDSDEDQMKGLNMAEHFPCVRAALTEGRTTECIADFPAQGELAASRSLVFATAVRASDGRIVGGAALGIPMWRLEQRISRQLQLDHSDEAGLVLWAYVYVGDEIYARPAAHPDLDQIVPTPAERAEGLRRSPGGFTTERRQYGRDYAFGILPVPSLGEGVGVILVRSDPV